MNTTSYHTQTAMKQAPKKPPATRVPYPQTPESAQQWLVAHGITVSELARQNKIHRATLTDLLRGQNKGNYGQAHLGAIALGLKPDPDASH